MLVAYILLAWILPAADAAPTSLVGEVVAVPWAGGVSALRVRSDSGAEVAVLFGTSTVFLRARPGATTLAGAEPMAADAVAKGDRVLCQGAPGDGGTLRARRIVVMARADVDAAQQKQREDWRRRGTSGVVVKIDPPARAFVARVRAAPGAAPAGGAGEATVVVDASSPGVAFRRYAAGSLRFTDARPAEFADLAIGDQVRVLGRRSEDGSRIVAEQVVSGSFRIVRGVLKQSADGVLSVQEEGRGGGVVAVSVADGALVRRLPPFVVARLLRAASGETADASAAGGPRTRAGTVAVPEAGAPRGAGPGADQRAGGWQGGGGGPRFGDPDEMLERLPPVAVGDLRPGEEVAALGPRTGEADRLQALKLVAWTVPETPAGGPGGRTGGRGRPGGAEGAPADPFSDLLGAGGDASW